MHANYNFIKDFIGQDLIIAISSFFEIYYIILLIHKYFYNNLLSNIFKNLI
jgi:hypothetical protein